MTSGEASILGALGSALLEYRPDGRWTRHPGAPEWFCRFWAEDAARGTELENEELLDAFPFLEAFLPDCTPFWESRTPGGLRSDFWTQTGADGREHHLQASAVRAGDRNWLVIEDAAGRFSERETLQQYAHDKDLLSRDLERATRAKSNFLATVSHEIRTPLNAILGMADLLAATPLSTDQREYVAVFQRAGGNLLSLLNDLLDLSKVEAGRLTIESIPFDLESVAEDVAEALAVRAHSKGLELCLRVDPDLKRFRVGDPHRLRQVLLNLVGNAIKFTAAGEVTVYVESGAGEMPRVSVSDTGIGIAPEQLRSIFDEFTQAESGTTREYGGTGLGLSISKQIVERMGGRIWAESVPGIGSTFRFEVALPIGETPPPEERVSLAGMRVWIHTLSATNASVLEEVALRWGAKEVVVAGTASPPVTGEFDLGVADLQLLEGTGAGRHFPASMVIPLIPSHNRVIDQLLCRDLGFKEWLVKPVMAAKLGETLRRGLAAAPAAAQRASLAGMRILVADDSADNRFLLRSYLRPYGADLVAVADGAAAVEQFASASFDLVLIDVQMPVLDGYAAVAKMRDEERHSGRKPLPILMLTAGTFETELAQSQAAGASALLLKPLQQTTLLAAIERQMADRLIVAVDPQLKEIVPWYLETRRQDLPEIFAALSSADFARLRIFGHNLRGTGTSYGFPRITDIGGGLEAAAKKADLDACRKLVEELAGYLGKVEWTLGSP